MSVLRNKRLTKELRNIAASPHAGITVHGETMDVILVELQVQDNALYADDTYTLRFRTSNAYPIESPECQFITTARSKTIPLHPHIYSNGHICLDILYSGWSPVHGIMSVSLSVQSMLAGNTLAQRPPDDEAYSTRTRDSSSKKTHFIFHDDSV